MCKILGKSAMFPIVSVVYQEHPYTVLGNNEIHPSIHFIQPFLSIPFPSLPFHPIILLLLLGVFRHCSCKRFFFFIFHHLPLRDWHN
jgi:hypothetical protein